MLREQLKKRVTREGAAFFLLMSALVFAIAFFGAVHVWAYTVVFSMILAAALLRLPDCIGTAGDGRRVLRLPKTPLTPMFLLMAGFLVFQMVPLPDAWLGKISAESLFAAQHALPPAGPDPASLRAPVAPYVFPVRQSLVRWMVYGLFFFTLVSLLTNRSRIEAAAWVMIVAASADCLYGLVETFSGHGSIFWYAKDSYRGHITGTFINRNHFAGLMEMGVLLALGLGMAASRHSSSRSSRGRTGLRAFFSKGAALGDPTASRRVLLFFLGIVMALGLIFSGSRGAMISLTGGLFLLGLLWLLKPRHRKKGLMVLVVFAAVLAYAIPMGVEKTAGALRLPQPELFETGSLC